MASRTRSAVVLSGLDRPHGLAFHDGWLYIAQTSAVARVHAEGGRHGGWRAGDARALQRRREPLVAVDRSSVPTARCTSRSGSTCNVCVEADSDRAAVLQFDADGTHGRIFAFGLRNPVGIAMEPATKAIWVSQNERDNLEPSHEDLPPDEINILQAGGDYGWPYCYSLAGRGGAEPRVQRRGALRADDPGGARAAGALGAARDELPVGGDDVPGGVPRRPARSPSTVRGTAAVPTGAKVVRVRAGERAADGLRGLHHGVAAAGWHAVGAAGGRGGGGRWIGAHLG